MSDEQHARRRTEDVTDLNVVDDTSESEVDSTAETLPTCTVLRTARQSGKSYETLDQEHDLDLEEIVSHVYGGCDCQTESEPLDSNRDRPCRDKYLLRVLYREREMQFKEIAELVDRHSETVNKYVEKFGISPIDSSNRTSSSRVNKLQRYGIENDEISIQPAED